MDSTSAERDVSNEAVFLHAADTPWNVLGAGVRRQILGTTSDLMLVRVDFERGAVGAVHNHPHRQVTWVAAGRFRVQVGTEFRELTQGDCFLAHANVPHGVEALESGTLIDVFTPMREDFLVPRG